MRHILSLYAVAFSLPSLSLTHAPTSPAPYSIVLKSGHNIVVNNSAILAGPTNSTASPVTASSSGAISNNGGKITYSKINPHVVKVQVNTNSYFVGARFSVFDDELFYGVWEYPWFDQITNTNVEFDLKGTGNSDGVNWSNARAPFFITNAGYGVYADTLEMGSFDFTTPGQAQFIFNASTLVYYIILPSSSGNYKSIIEEYTALSSRIEMPPDSGYGPTFWSDDFEEDFHGSVSNAQDNYYDVVNHLYYNEIRATSMFADRPYGTGNMSFGNFDFDLVYYPSPKQFIANLSDYGFDFQVWVANRAFNDTQLYNEAIAKNWLFPGYNAANFNGPALNLSIPAAYNYFKERLSNFTNLGVKGYKIDRGEEGEMPVYEQNVQMTLFEQLCYENMVSKWGESNFYTFARSAVDRSRSRTAIWNGDSHSNFSGLAYSVASGIRAGLLGFSQWGVDCGGYIRGTDDPTEELWARWMHFSTFSPAYEIMIGTNHTPWYPPYTERLVSILKDTANLHTALFPYIKSYTYEATQTGVPVIRALMLEYPHDSKVYTTTDTYAFGEEFLVAPIVNAGGTREVYFPTGTSYLEYFNKTDVYQGGTTHSVSLGWEYVPVYVREGAIIPTGDIYQGNQKWTKWVPYLEIQVFPSYDVPKSEFKYYNAAKNESVLITATTNKKQQSVTLVYGDLGTPGTIVVYGRGGGQNITLKRGGGSATVKGFLGLFG